MARAKKPILLVSDSRRRLFEIDGYEAPGMRLLFPFLPETDEWILLPENSALMFLPKRIPVGWDAVKKRFTPVASHLGKPVTAVAAFAAPAHTQLYTAAYKTQSGAPVLPLFAYSPVGWMNGRFWTTAVRVDGDVRHDPDQFDRKRVLLSARRMIKRYPGNRLVRHLVENCVKRYACPNAFNFVLERWECPVPVSASCSARCIGCISRQPRGAVRSSQDRISFLPNAEEIVEMALPHLEKAERAMISFGQGCEGEPLTQWALIEKSIRLIRGRTRRGTVHLNTHAGHPAALERLLDAGLDSIRVSMNSAREGLYTRYFRPRGYGFKDVLQSLKAARRHGAYVSLNYFIFPGLTDHPGEMEALFRLLDRYEIDCIQARNLNIDPEQYVRGLGLDVKKNRGHSAGILEWMSRVKKKAPKIRIGYFNPPREDWNRRP
jgi:pyruvate-formate lyase-activating enzyme